MKKTLSLILVIIMTALLLCSCKSTPADDAVIRIGGLKGATSIGMVKLLDDAENGKSELSYDYTLAGSADELTPLIIKGELDIAAIPLNLASVLCGKTDGKIKLLAINTLGVLYITAQDDGIKTFSDLKGKTVYATGKGSTPEYSLRYLLSENGLDPDSDVDIQFKSEPTEIVALMKKDPSVIAMLPQPYVTAAKAQVSGLRVVLDLTEEWDRLDNGSRLITAGLVVNSDFAEKHPSLVKSFLTEYEASTKFANESVDEAAGLTEKYGIIGAAVAKQAIPYCNITCITGSEMKAAASGYLKVLFDQNASAVGGALPNDDFYYEK